MIFELVHLAMALGGSPSEAVAIANDVRDVVLGAGALPLALDGDDAAARTARLLLTWSHRESRWVTAAKDNAGACGVMQVSTWHLAGLGTSCARVRADRREGLRAGLELMRQLIAACGSVRAGLGSYAAGPCGAAPQLVAWRCHLAGGAC